MSCSSRIRTPDMAVLAGKVRPSQTVTQFGPGALIDLPTLSMVVNGIGDWDTSTARRVDEPRLAGKLGVKFFRRPPYFRRQSQNGGLPVRVFPQFMVCPHCYRLVPYTSFRFKEQRGNPEYVCTAAHQGGREQAAHPARFMVACRRGHLDDFPWHHYVHGGDTECRAELKLTDSGRTGAITDLWVQCPDHNKSRNLGQATGIVARSRLPRCRGYRPWLGTRSFEQCDEEIHVILRGASNAYFPVVESAISVPPWSDPIQIAIGEYSQQLENVNSLEDLLNFLRYVNAPELEEFPPDRVWEGIQRRRSGDLSVSDLRREEWASFTRGRIHNDPQAEFQVRPTAVPVELGEFIAGVTQVVRLREVRALRGFTRIDPIPDVGDLGEVEAIRAGLAPLATNRLDWLPGIDQRGEGVFIQLREEAIVEWERRTSVSELQDRHVLAQREWYAAREMTISQTRPVRYLLLHTLAHLLIRQFGLDCGYSSSSLRERIYCSEGADAMAGILIYTASPDSEGSLGGLVEMSRPEHLGPMLERALENSKLCANDPLCAGQIVSATGTQLNGAGCHACVLESETSCETGNNYLDRAVLAGTLRSMDTAFVPDR